MRVLLAYPALNHLYRLNLYNISRFFYSWAAKHQISPIKGVTI